MLASTPILLLARITLEATSPLSLPTGRNGSLLDAQIVTDANGLPTIPGTALAGALRHALTHRQGSATAKEVFGQALNGAPSPLTVTWAHIHDSHDQPIDGLDIERGWTRDPLLSVLMSNKLPSRNHIRLGTRGTTAGHGRFELAFVPPGHRFTFEMALWDSPAESLRTSWEALKAILADSELRIGGATRRGYGQFYVQRYAERRFDLRDATDFLAYARHPKRLDHPTNLHETELAQAPAVRHWLRMEICMEGEDLWRLGGGDIPMVDPPRPSESLPYIEERVAWTGSRGHLARRRIIVPASAIKGALAHRTAFHYNRLTGRFADALDPRRIDLETPERNPATRYLFGHSAPDPTQGRSGSVLIDDAAVDDPDIYRLAHNSLDRYTGGIRDGVFYCEEAVYKSRFKLRMKIAKDTWHDAPAQVKEAFHSALDDLLEGRLPIGAASARGLGYFQGNFLRNELKDT